MSDALWWIVSEKPHWVITGVIVLVAWGLGIYNKLLDRRDSRN